MTLEESVDNLEKMESNGISAYIDPNLKNRLAEYGEITVDYVSRGISGGGFMIQLTNGQDGCNEG
jgi:Fe-S cluster assembly iron-binding protein IscA